MNLYRDYFIALFRLYAADRWHPVRALRRYTMDVARDASELRRDVAEGHVVNYIALNRVRVTQMSQKMQAFRELSTAQKEEDERLYGEVLKQGMNMQSFTKLHALKDRIKHRDRLQNGALKAQLNHDRTFSHRVQEQRSEEYCAALTQRRAPPGATQAVLQQLDGEYEALFIRYAADFVRVLL